MPVPISGKMLNLLKASLGTRVTSLQWLFGWASPQWISMTHKGPGELPGQHSILIRLLLDRPDLSPIPEIPSGKEVYELLHKYDPTLTPRRFPILLGLQPGSKDRMLDDNANRTAAISNYMLIIKKEMERLETDEEKREFVAYLCSVAEDEAESRGLDREKFWVSGGWSKSMKTKAKKV